MVILILYTALFVPYRVAFEDQTSQGSQVFDLIVDILFLIDICITFNSTYYRKDGLLETSRKKIAIEYLTTWFLLDLLTSLPYQILENLEDYGSQVKVIKVSRIPRMYKIFRVLKMIKVFRVTKILVGRKFPGIAKFVS